MKSEIRETFAQVMIYPFNFKELEK